MRRGAALVAEDRVLAMGALARVAALAAVQEARELEPPVPTPRRLEEIAADRPHRAKLRRRRNGAGLAQRLRHFRIPLELGEGRAGSDPGAVDAARNEGTDVDQRLGLDDPLAQERHEV